MDNQRSQQYDWFKGANGKKQEKKTFKQNVKDAIKWTKIFSYVALFVFSMFGCVQVFTIQTSNGTGAGIEIYHNANDVSPVITEMTFSKGVAHGQAGDGDDTKSDKPVHNVYVPEVTAASGVWINRHDDQDLLNDIHEYVQKTQKVELKDAYKGTNTSTVIRGDTKTSWEYLDANGIKQSENMSSAAEDIFTEITNESTDEQIDEINSRKAGFDSEGNPLVFSSAAKTFVENDIENPAVNFGGFYIPAHTSFDVVERNGVKYHYPVFSAIEIKIDSSNFENSTDKILARANMASKMLDFYFGDNKNSPIAEFLGGDDQVALLEKMDSEIYFNDWDSEVEKHNFQIDTQQSRIVGITNILGAIGFDIRTEKIEYDDKDGQKSSLTIISEIVYREGRFPSYMSENSNWRPITTWGESFSLGPFYGFFVYPMGAMASGIVTGFGDMNGWEAMMTIFIVVFAVRLLTFTLSFKSTIAQSKMQDLAGKKAAVEAKYVQYEGNKQMEMRKRQEVADLYKKNDVNPMASLGSMFLTMPFFLAIWRVIGGIPHLKAASWLGILFSATSYQEFFAGQWQYLPLMLLAAGIQLFSQLYPRLLNKKRDSRRMNAQEIEAMKKANKTQNITMGVFVFMSLIFSAGLQIYWIVGGIWRIMEVRITHGIKERHKQKRRK